MQRFIKFLNCTEGINSDNPSEITRSDIHNVLRILFNKDNHENDQEYGCAPMRCSFTALCNKEFAKDLKQNIDGFISVDKYPKESKILDGEVGQLCNVRFILERYDATYLYDHTTSKLGNKIYNIFIIKSGEIGNDEMINLRCTLSNKE